MPNITGFSWLSQLGVSEGGLVRAQSRIVTAGKSDAYNLAVGAGVGAVNWAWSDEGGSIAASGNAIVDLAGVLTDDITGNIFSFAGIKFIKYVMTGGVAGSASRLGGGSNPFLGPWGATGFAECVYGGNGLNGEFTFINQSAGGWPVTATTGDFLKILNMDGANTINYRLYLAGI